MRAIVFSFIAALLLACPASGQETAPTEPAPLALETDDAAIEARLEALYAELEGLEAVTVETRAGVVTLGGAVATPESAARAASLARRLEGVVDVREEIAVSAEISDRARPALERIEGMGTTIQREWPIWLAALALFLLFLLAALTLSRAKALFDRLSPNPFVADLVRGTIFWALVLAGLIAAFDLAGAAGMMSAVIGAAGVAGLAIGFALKDTVANYIASTLLTLRRPFEAGELVCIGDHEGAVARLTTRSTIPITLDGNHLSIPNSIVVNSVITNYSRRPQRRFSFELGIGAADDAGHACKLARAALEETPGVLADPPAACIVKAFGDYNLVLEASGWVEQTEDSFLLVRGVAIAAVRDKLLANAIDLPDPIVQVRQLPAAAPAAAVEHPSAPEPAKAPGAVTHREMAAERPETETAQQAEAERNSGQNLMKKAAPE